MNVYKGSYPFENVDGYWWFWTDPHKDKWSLKTISWVGFRRLDGSRVTKEDIECMLKRKLVNPYIRYFWHPIKRAVVMLTNETKRRECLDGKI